MGKDFRGSNRSQTQHDELLVKSILEGSPAKYGMTKEEQTMLARFLDGAAAHRDIAVGREVRLSVACRISAGS